VYEQFDIAFSSHVIEHTLDFIKHLNQVCDILKNNGHYFLFVPDKRYCFDYFSPESTMPDGKTRPLEHGHSDGHE
jgi:predicted SAM-dependent methyltransferase